ncbi:MCE family protein [Rhodococcus erythropolis]|uniref:MCE family protein n=1 Tax=Rhodococcus erythropolis TaxID=1833 RepID=UPI001E44832F|nr:MULTISPECIES: MCE family protein [Rhodococcus erythropolis group]MCD2107914.1 MCE family protein [Rhodococcus qingshengii]MCZ4527085.1 MCE family protein [Rhodococcus erythropolis]
MSRLRTVLTLTTFGVMTAAALSYTVVPMLDTITVTAEFENSTGLYEGDDVRIMGVKVGEVESIEPDGDRVNVTLSIDDSQPVPDDAQAIVVSQSLVSARFVQLAPTYTGGPTMVTGDRIPLARTAIPVEWDQIKEQLSRLTEAVGPDDSDPVGPLGELTAAAAKNLDGQGESLNQSLRALSDATATLSDGRGDLFAAVRNLSVFVSALAASGEQIVSFNNRMATVTDVLADNKEDIGSALTALDTSLGEVERFVRENRDGLDTTVLGLADVTGTLASQRDGLAQILHVAPTALSNLQSIYQPAHNAVVSSVSLTNFANPVNFVCSALAAAEQVDAERGSELCVEYLGPMLKLLAVETLPIRLNPARGVGALPDQLIYTEPDLRPISLEDMMMPGAVR